MGSFGMPFMNRVMLLTLGEAFKFTIACTTWVNLNQLYNDNSSLGKRSRWTIPNDYTIYEIKEIFF